MRGNFDRSGRLIRFMLRRERIISAIWIVILVLFCAALAPAMDAMFAEPEARQQFGESFDNPVMIAIMGPAYGADSNNYTTGAMYSNTMLIWVIMAVAVMNIFIVIRHTRADEEGGRTEVIRALPTGRLAGINAAMITAAIVDILLAVLTGVALAATGVPGMGLGASMLYGFAVGAGGLVFAGIAAVFSQLSSSKGGATGLSFLMLGIFYMIRAAGDMQGSDALACISPLGLAQRSQIYVANNIWPVVVLLAEAVILAIIAYALNSVRDMDQGFIPARPGRTEASKRLGSPFGLSSRLLRNMLVTWIIVMFALAASYGSVIADIPSFVGDSPEYLQVIGIPEEVVNSMTDAGKAQIIIDYFGVFVISMMTLICFIPVINSTLRIRAEERDGRIGQIYALPVSRAKYLTGYVILAYAASVLLQLATAIGLYCVTSMLESNPFTIGGLVGSFFAYLPAIWVIIGLAVLIVGAFPRATGAVWGFYAFVFLVSFLGGMPDLMPASLRNISPVTHIPRLPLDDMTFAPLIILTVIAIALTAAGFTFYKKRDTL
ncbi:MAG: hypothetical protein FWG48_00755 [Oscillospiraceae bacterium]|nr:hypothetical protein [Oscillospiraceae bacterium]